MSNNSTTRPPRPRLRWHLLELMARRGIRRNSDLMQRLDAVGVHISRAQISRVVDEMPNRLNTDTLRGLMMVLDCSASDLISIEYPDAAQKPAAGLGDGPMPANVTSLESRRTQPTEALQPPDKPKAEKPKKPAKKRTPAFDPLRPLPPGYDAPDPPRAKPPQPIDKDKSGRTDE